MRSAKTFFAVLLIALGTVLADAQAADSVSSKGAAFFKGLACRNAQVLGGQNNIGAILYHDPMETRPRERDASGNPMHRLSDAVRPLGVFRVARPDAKARETSRVSVAFSSNSGAFAVLDYLKRAHETQFYWTPTDELIIWNWNQLWFADGHLVRSGSAFDFERIGATQDRPIERTQGDPIPEHIDYLARVTGARRYMLEFDVRARNVEESPVHPGPLLIVGEDQLGWTQSDVFIRLIRFDSTHPRHLEIGPPEGRRPWGWFAPLTFPRNATLLLARDNSELKIPEALLLWRNERSVSEIAVVRLGDTKPTILAADHIKKVFWYPDRTKLYGYTDHAGRFHPLPSERHSSAVLFWLEQLKRMDGIEEFYLLDRARYAVVKRNGAATGAEAVVLERRGSRLETLEHLCRTNSPVKSVVEGPDSFLFLPHEPVGDKLVVYLHDGPFTSVGKGGDWITDIVAQTGTPVLAINYFGSSSRLRELAVAREIAPMLAADVERAVAFAQKELPGQERKPIFVAQGFGTFVGFASMMAGAAWPDRFIAVSGMTDPLRIFADHVPSRDPFALNYLARAGRQLGLVMNPSEAASRGTRFLFIHGDSDDKVPHAELVRFVDRLNEAPHQGQAELLTVEGMGHSPDAKPDYQAILEAMQRFLRQP
jgi:hypothetical protein